MNKVKVATNEFSLIASNSILLIADQVTNVTVPLKNDDFICLQFFVIVLEKAEKNRMQVMIDPINDNTVRFEITTAAHVRGSTAKPIEIASNGGQELYFHLRLDSTENQHMLVFSLYVKGTAESEENNHGAKKK